MLNNDKVKRYGGHFSGGLLRNESQNIKMLNIYSSIKKWSGKYITL